jgi:hypothetical protein
MVLQWCYSGVTVVLQWCLSGVTMDSLCSLIWPLLLLIVLESKCRDILESKGHGG